MGTANERLKANWRRLAFIWHRRIGLAAMIFLLLLAASGLALNHGDRLGLADTYADADWLLDWYGIEAPPPASGFETEAGWVIQGGDNVFLNGLPLARADGPLTGAAWSGALLAVATGNSLWLFLDDGTLVEKLGRSALPGKIDGLGRGPAGDLRLRTGGAVYNGGQDAVEWRPAGPGETVAWSRATQPPAAIARSIALQARGQGVSWERLLLDLHSGRLFGLPGTLIADLAALALILLAASGLYNWTTRR